MIDPLGTALRLTPHFKGKAKIYRFWEKWIAPRDLRMAQLPDGSTVEADMSVPYERMVWIQGEEWDELQLLQRRLNPGETFIDVGANIGLWTLTAASTVGADGRIFSFEPNPATFRKLKANITRNGRDEIVTAFSQAVSGEIGMVAFACEVEHNVSAIAAFPNGSNIITVPAVTLDSIVPSIDGRKVAGMKLDTEGHELVALQGAQQIIAGSSPWLIVEFNTTLLPSQRLGDWGVYKFLRGLGYSPFIYNSQGVETSAERELVVRGYRNILFRRAL